MTPLLEARNLKKYFKTKFGMLHAVDDVNFSLEEAPIPEEIIAGRKLVMDSEENGQKTVLQPLEARMYEIAKQEGSNR